MRVMTFNLRFENDRDGLDAWALRRGQVVRLIEECAPAVLGTQEGTWAQLVYLDEELPGHTLHAPGRLIDQSCQYPTLFLRTAAGAVLDGGEFWLSTTPDEHRSKDWDSAFPRMLSWASFTDGASGRTISAAVTHLDHIGAAARVEQAQIVAEWVRSRPGPVIVMGDFNDAPGSRVHEILTAPDTGLRDTWQVLGMAEGPESFTRHGFNGVPCKTRMDWILASPHFAVRGVQIVRRSEDHRFPSDHFPYVVDLELTT